MYIFLVIQIYLVIHFTVKGVGIFFGFINSINKYEISFMALATVVLFLSYTYKKLMRLKENG